MDAHDRKRKRRRKERADRREEKRTVAKQPGRNKAGGGVRPKAGPVRVSAAPYRVNAQAARKMGIDLAGLNNALADFASKARARLHARVAEMGEVLPIQTLDRKIGPLKPSPLGASKRSGKLEKLFQQKKKQARGAAKRRTEPALSSLLSNRGNEAQRVGRIRHRDPVEKKEPDERKSGHPRDEKRNCKSRPENKRSKGGGGKRGFIPWCG